MGASEKEVGLTEQGGPVLHAGEALVHVGPAGIGTTTLHTALSAAGEQLANQGVVYLERRHQGWSSTAAVPASVAGTDQRPGAEPARDLQTSTPTRAGRRVVVSDETLADADPDRAARVVQELGGWVRVVITVQPLAVILPSAWQSVVQTGVRTPYERWLQTTLGDVDEEPTSAFWWRHRHDRLVERWVQAVGEQNVCVLVTDETDPAGTLRRFESLIGLSDGVLTPASVGDTDDRSLTYGEIELVRDLNNEFENLGITRTGPGRRLRRGVIRQMRSSRPGHDDAGAQTGMLTPEWARDRCAEIGAEMASNIACSGAHVIGNISALGRLDPAPQQPPVRTISVELASAAVLGSVRAAKPELCGARDRNGSGKRDLSAERSVVTRSTRPEHGRVADVTAGQLVTVLARRLRRRMRRTLLRRR